MLSISNITKNVIPYINLNDSIVFSRHTYLLLKNFFNHIRKSDTEKINIIKYNYPVENIEDLELPNKSKYFPEEIIQDIKERCNYVYKYIVPILDYKFNITFICYNKNEKINKYVKLIVIWIKLVLHLSNSICPKELSIKIYLTNKKKCLPNKNNILSPININSAYTYGGCHEYNEIIIYRKEEWFKVLLHECIHAFGFDYSFINNVNINKNIKSIFPINSEIHSYESYCETWAIIMNSIFHAYLSEPIYLSQFINKFREIYTYECLFSYIQMNKVLSHMHLSFTDLYSKDKISVYKRNKFYKEETNVFAYFVLKLIYMQNLNIFFDFCFKNNNIFKFNIKNIQSYVKIIDNNFKNIPFQHDNIEYSGIKKSLRFSIFDLE